MKAGTWIPDMTKQRAWAENGVSGLLTPPTADETMVEVWDWGACVCGGGWRGGVRSQSEEEQQEHFRDQLRGRPCSDGTSGGQVTRGQAPAVALRVVLVVPFLATVSHVGAM